MSPLLATGETVGFDPTGIPVEPKSVLRGDVCASLCDSFRSDSGPEFQPTEPKFYGRHLV